MSTRANDQFSLRRFVSGVCDMVSFRNAIRSNYFIKIPKRHAIIFKLNGKHAGEGSIALHLILFEIIACKVENLLFHEYLAFELFITGLNIDVK